MRLFKINIYTSVYFNMDLMVCFYCQRRKVALTTKRFNVIIMSVYISVKEKVKIRIYNTLNGKRKRRDDIESAKQNRKRGKYSL